MAYQPLPAVGQTTQAASLPVVLPSDGIGTASTAPIYQKSIGTTAVSGNVTSSITGTTSINIYQVNGVVISLGQTVSASSMPVALASDGIGSASTTPIYAKVVGTSTISGSVTSTPTGTTTVTGTTAISGTSTITGTVTTSPSGTTTITGTVTTSPSGTTTISGTTAISGTSTITGTVTTSPSGTTTISGNVTSTPTGTTTITGTVTSVPSGTTTISGNVTSTPTGITTINIYGFGTTAVTLGQKISASSMPVVLASDGLGSASTTPLFIIQQPLTKGTQGTTGVSVQNLRDAGRVYKVFYLDNIAGITSEALATTNINSGGTLSTSTSYSVTAGKTLRLTAISGTIKDTSTTAAYGRIRVRSAGTVNATSGIVMALDINTPLGTSLAGGGTNVSYEVPDGIEIAASQQIGITHIENSASASTSVIVTGFEY